MLCYCLDDRYVAGLWFTRRDAVRCQSYPVSSSQGYTISYWGYSLSARSEWYPIPLSSLLFYRSGREPSRNKPLWSGNAELLYLIRWQGEVLLRLTRTTLYSQDLLPL